MSTRVLIADNNRPSLMVTKDFFESVGFEVCTAVNSAAVRMWLEQGRFEVVILDMQLDDHSNEQDLSGLLIAKTTAACPVIIFTSNPSVEAVQLAFGANFYGYPAVADFICKAEGLDALLKAVRKVLNGQGQILGLSA